MVIYDPFSKALGLPPLGYELPDPIEGIDYFPWKRTPPVNTGFPMSNEQKQILSQKMKGRNRSQEARDAISRGKTGKSRKPFSVEHKRKLSEAAKRQRAREKALKLMPILL